MPTPLPIKLVSAAMKKFFSHRWFRLFSKRPRPAPEIEQARALIRAIDAGGVPLNPAKVNHIARNIGLEVSRRAPVEETIKRIRAALERSSC